MAQDACRSVCSLGACTWLRSSLGNSWFWQVYHDKLINPRFFNGFINPGIRLRASQKNGWADLSWFFWSSIHQLWVALFSAAPRWQWGSTHQSRGSRFPPAPGEPNMIHLDGGLDGGPHHDTMTQTIGLLHGKNTWETHVPIWSNRVKSFQNRVNWSQLIADCLPRRSSFLEADARHPIFNATLFHVLGPSADHWWAQNLRWGTWKSYHRTDLRLENRFETIIWFILIYDLPSGYLTVHHGKPPIEIDGLPIKNGDFPWLCNK